jgi:hypothetical protein
MHPDEKTAVLGELCIQAEQLVKANPRDHQLMNDAGTVAFFARMHSKGKAVSVEAAQHCVERMRIAVESGEYPEGLPDTANSITARSDAMLRLHGGMLRIMLDGVPERGRFQFVPVSDSFEVLYLATSGPRLKPPILITDAMIETAEIKEGVIYLRQARER